MWLVNSLTLTLFHFKNGHGIMTHLCDAHQSVYPQIYKGDPRPCIPPSVMASSNMRLKLGVLCFCRLHMQNKWVHDLRSPCGVLRMFIFTSRPQYMQVTYTSDELWLFWVREKLEYSQYEPHAGIEMAQVLGSPLFICGVYHIINTRCLHTYSCELTIMHTFQLI